ncbi:hypothetical protein [Rhizobium straminoryzae]|uniref:Uncharacterized protein n=1 Tax=Rhizobium straminoryzae TaxID=1387186 RepID=A0A549T0U5_9HYPH|nr:hypothetical protein [Rhizobium straminoryzae]TRL35504.1 hypothetical protein FNA46_20100 [Rhizobium straminoryzae]
MDAVTKGQFAALIGVSPGRVSQYLAEGKISPAALHGNGRNARIIVERAKADLRLALDISQRMGNGIDTRLDGNDESLAPLSSYRSRGDADEPPLKTQKNAVDHEIKQQKLEQLRRVNRNGAIADAKAIGTLTETEAARAEMARMATRMIIVFESGLSDLATAITEEFKVPQRDVLHLLRREFRKLRSAAAKQARDEAAALPETTETALEVEEIETLN